MRVAVVIVNYNAGEYLSRCLDSLEAQTRRPDLVVVVDNNSEDDSTRALKGRPDWITLLPLARNTGFARANNIAISFLESFDRLALLNPDTIAEPRWLEALLDAAARHDAIDSFGSRMLGYHDEDPADGTADVYHVSGLYWRRHHGKSPQELPNREDEIFSPCAAAALYDFKSVTDLGGFDENYFCYSEDVDLGFRLRSRGSRAWYVPDAVVRHAGSATTGRRSEFTTYHGHRNLVWTFVKNMPGLYLWRYLPQHLLMNLVSVVVFAARGQGRAILRAKRDAIAGLPRAIAQRRTNRYLRLVPPGVLVSVMRREFLAPYRNRHE